MSVHGRAPDYLDELLTAEEEAAFIFHLPDCPLCQAALLDETQLRDREEDLLRRHRLRRLLSLFVRGSQQLGMPIVSLLASSALIMMALTRADPSGADQGRSRPSLGGPSLPPAPTRSIEPRLSYAGASAFRPYDVSRSLAVDGEPISWQAIAEMERAGDCHGMAVAYLLAGELVRADTHFAGCPRDPGLDADRAALALLRGQPGEALVLADRALAREPDHPVAIWNQALALRDLGLGLSAADGFERVAALDPVWREEAMRRARSLRGELDGLRESWLRTVQLGNAMIEGGPPIPVDLARRHPARARILLDHAIRSARTGARLEELRPLAVSLEGMAGEGIVDHLRQVGRRLRPERLALLDAYTSMAIAQAAAEPAFSAWIERARRARADDLVLAALATTGRIGDWPEEATRMAASTGNPWIELDVLANRAAHERRSGKLATAAAFLDDADRRCAAGAAAYRCLIVSLERARLELDRYHPATARRLAVLAQRRAEELGEWPERTQAIHVAAEAERLRDEKISARALYRESARGERNCRAIRAATTLEAELLFDEHRIQEARALAAGRETCGDGPELVDLVLEVELLRAHVPLRDRADLEAALDEVSGAAPHGSSERLLLDYLHARAQLDQDVDAAGKRLRAVLDEARRNRGHPLARRVTRSAEMALFVTAGERGRWWEAVGIAAEARGVEAPLRCLLAIGGDKFRLTLVAVGPTGRATGVYVPDLIPSPQWTMPDLVADGLRGCDSVDVLALPPWLGGAQWMDPALAWRHVLKNAAPASKGVANRLVVAAPRPPASAQLPVLGPWIGSPEPDAERLTGPNATFKRFAAAAGRATLIEIHAHTTRVESSDAPAIALADGMGDWFLTAERARKLDLQGAPVVVLADCGAGIPARYAHTSWGLPAAFLDAGARSVIAALAPIPDGEATSFFAGVTDDIERGVPVAKAVASARARKLASSAASWVRSVVVFE